MESFSRGERLGLTLNTTRKSGNSSPKFRLGVNDGKVLRENIEGNGTFQRQSRVIRYPLGISMKYEGWSDMNEGLLSRSGW